MSDLLNIEIGFDRWRSISQRQQFCQTEWLELLKDQTTSKYALVLNKGNIALKNAARRSN